jgi:hypothetical protein
MAYLMEQLVTYHLNATLHYREPPEALHYVREFIHRHKVITGMMGDLHDEVFLVVKKNGYTHDDIGGTETPRRRPPTELR